MPGSRIIAIGNRDRGDDAVGHLVAQHLRRYRLAGVAIVECGGEAARILELLHRTESAVLVDAARCGAAPGTIRCIDCTRRKLPAGASASSHGVGPAEAIELARALGTLPRRCVFYAIAAGCWEFAAPISPAVADAAAAAAMIARDLAGQPRR